MNLIEAQSIAENICSVLASACKRIEIAGSIRRRKAEPGDIEIVAVPDLRMPHATFGRPCYSSALDMILDSLQYPYDGNLCLQLCKGGHRFKQFGVSTDGGQTYTIKLDLFIVTPPADFGVIYLIRTGPKEFSQWIVTQRFLGGGLPNGYRVEGGRVVSHDGKHMPCPEEIDFLNFCRLCWIEPKNRRPLWLRPVRKIVVHNTV